MKKRDEEAPEGKIDLPEAQAVNVELTCTEIGGLWSACQQETMSNCFLTYLLHHLQDADIIPLAQRSLALAQRRIDKIKLQKSSCNLPSLAKGNSLGGWTCA